MPDVLDKTLREINESGSKLDKLKKLSSMLAEQMDGELEPRVIAPIARQYRETIEAIDKIEQGNEEPDEIDKIIKRSIGKMAQSGTNSKSRAS